MHSLIFASNSVIERFGLILFCFSVSGHVWTVVLEIDVRRQDTAPAWKCTSFSASLFQVWNQLRCNWITQIREHRYRDTPSRRCGLKQDTEPPYHPQSGLKSLTNMFNQREQTVPRPPASRERERPKCLRSNSHRRLGNRCLFVFYVLHY